MMFHTQPTNLVYLFVLEVYLRLYKPVLCNRKS